MKLTKEEMKLVRDEVIKDKTLTKLCEELKIPLWKGMEIGKLIKNKKDVKL